MQFGQRLGEREGALARRIDQPLVRRALGHQVRRAEGEQVARLEARVRRQPIERRVVACALHQRLAAFDAQHHRRLRGQRQAEVAQAAEPVDDPLAALQVQQRQGAAHEHAVDRGVDLREVGGLEGQAHAELGQRVGQLGPHVVETAHAVRPLGLQPPLHLMALAEVAQPRQVGRAQRLEVAQHQRRHLVAHGQLDLRQPVALLHRADQFAQRQQQPADLVRQHRTDLHVGHVARLALVEADQHRALLRHMAHRQPRAVAVAPCGPFDGPQQLLRLDLGQVPQVVFQHALLDCDLRLRVQMLHLAAATGAGMQAEMGAGRAHALRAFAPQRRHRALLPVVLLARDAAADDLAGQRALDEHHLAVGAACHALRFQVERLDRQPFVFSHGGRLSAAPTSRPPAGGLETGARGVG